MNTIGDRAAAVLDRVALGAVALALALAFLTPPEVNQGNVARLFYLHVPSVSVAYLAFASTLLAGVAFLATRRIGFDHLAVASAEVGVLFTGIFIVAGMIWAKPTWGVYWTWSARLTLTAIMFFVYLGYLALRRTVDDPVARARRSAVYGILSIVLVPIIHFSVVWWRDIHQLGTLASPVGIQMDGILVVAFLAGFVAFVLVAAALIRRRYLLAALEAAGHAALRRGAGGVAGDAVSAPRGVTSDAEDAR